jgi:cyclic di-GMP phosphodiesterase
VQPGNYFSGTRSEDILHDLAMLMKHSELRLTQLFTLLVVALKLPGPLVSESEEMPMNVTARIETSVGRVLIVDDEPSMRKFLATMLTDSGVACGTAASGEEALGVLEQGEVTAVLADLHMPRLSGMQLLLQVRPRYPDVAFLVVTGEDDVRVGIEAMRNGADDYLVKPLQPDVVLASLQRALEKKVLQRELEKYKRQLEEMVAKRTEQLESALGQLERSYGDTLRALGAAIDLRDGPTAGHSHRVALYSLKIAAELGLREHELKTLSMGASLHDIGKLAIPDSILLKPGALSEEEWCVMRTHVQIGYDLVKQIPFLSEAAEIVLTHHERWDGAGYPRGLAGMEVPLGARIFAVADTLDAMTSNRPYRSAGSFREAHEEIRRLSGIQYDPRVCDGFLRIPVEVWEGIRIESASH